MALLAGDREALDQTVVRGSELLKQGQLDQAQRAFRSALEVEPDNARVLALLGLSHFRANEFAEARVVYEQLVERAPTDASHRLNLGLVYLKLNDADHAIGALEASRALDPSQGRAVSYLGLAYARAGRYAEAYRAFLIAGQNDLAIEIESNLGQLERDRIHAQLGRTPQGALPDPVPMAPAGVGALTGVALTAERAGGARIPTPPGMPRLTPAGDPTAPPAGGPRTTPPSAPPKGRSVHEAAAPEPPASAEITSERDGALRLEQGSPAAAPVRHTESMQFVLPRADPAAPQPASPGDAASMISRAVASATPSPTIGPRTRAGGSPPRPLSELATDDLVRPDDGDDAFEIGGGGALIIRVTGRVMTRLDGVHVTGGDLGYEAALRRSRGHNTDERFDYGGSQLHAVSGRGYLIAVPGKHTFSAVSLDDDILYLREDLVFAFQASLRWENGNVPGLRGKLPVVQFRGDGALALRLTRPLVRVKLPAQGTVFIDAERLAGWIGRVIPRAVVPPVGGPLGTMCVECTGEGIVLVEPADPDAAARAADTAALRPARRAELEAAMVAPVTPPADASRDAADLVADLAADLAIDSTFDPARDSLDRLDEL
ncbi:MAG TPA: tetratricopeptide repeat protein [Kofleriaceae bacterium]|nr:tetratricopeptide repeat protein [Kofleriaceae bacterium]